MAITFAIRIDVRFGLTNSAVELLLERLMLVVESLIGVGVLRLPSVLSRWERCQHGRCCGCR